MRPIWILLFALGCAGSTEEPACDAASDLDADGLDDCLEAELGTDKNRADSDGDGVGDGAELDCVSDPLDETEVCYACGWEHNDPGDLAGIGPNEGDTLKNLKMTDQCGETVPMHDLAGDYHILFMTTQWCTACLAEASELRDRTIDFENESGLGFSYIIALFQDAMGEPPDPEVAAEYAEVVDAKKRIPVLSDGNQGVLDHTPYDGNDLPGKCVLSDEMEILDCFVGHGDDAEAFDLIRDHAGI